MDYKYCRAKELLESHGRTVLSPKMSGVQKLMAALASVFLNMNVVAYCDELEHAPYVRVNTDKKEEPIPLGSAIIGRCGLCGAELQLASNYSVYVSDKFAGRLCEKCGDGSLEEIYERVSKKCGDENLKLGKE